jgi:hypothetical protein
MTGHLRPSNLPAEAVHWMFYLYEEELPLLEFLRRNRRTVSLSTKLHLMSQVCSLLQFFHKQGLAYFVQLDNLFVTRGVEVRVRGFARSHRVTEWTEVRKDQEGTPNVRDLLLSKEQLV